MKKNIFILFLVMVILLAGCASDVDDSSSDVEGRVDPPQAEDIAGEEEYKSIDENENQEEGKEEEDVEDRQLQNEKEKIHITVYYQDGDGYIVPVTRGVPKQEGIARAAINGLIDSPIIREELEYYGLYPVLPQGTEVLGINIKDGIATIDFNEALLNYEREIDERNIIASVVYTLTEFNTVDGVKVWINGYADRELKFGTSLSGVLNRQNVLINSKKVKAGGEKRKVDVYLFKAANDTFTYILPVSVELSGVNESEIPGTIADLLNEDYGDRLYTEVPSEASLIGSSINGSTITLNFNEGIKMYGGGSARENGLLKQILFSMKQIEGIKRVKLLINGETAILPEGTDLSSPVAIPQRINDVIDK